MCLRPLTSFALLYCLLLSLPSAEAQSELASEPIIGANVDMGVILPGSKNYIQTPQGDLFDIAKAAKLNTFRVTAQETWGKNQMDRPYTAEEWKSVAARAKATQLRLIPELILPQGYIQAIDQQERLTVPNVATYSKAFIQLADTILGEAGLAKDGSLAMIDLSNEEAVQSPIIHDTLKAVYDHIHTQYSGVLVTVGGYKSVRTSQTVIPPEIGFRNAGLPYHKEQWVTGNPDDGGPALDCEDVVSVHVYGDFAKHDNPLNFLRFASRAEVANSMLNYLKRVSRWSKNEPILVEEFGSPSGAVPLSVAHKQLAPYATPENQQKVIQGVIDAIIRAKKSGINVIGGLVWVFAPRGGTENEGDEANEDTLIVPQVNNKPPLVLPALKDIPAGLKILYAQ